MDHSLAYKLVVGTLIGDAVGAGWEVKTREQIIARMNELDSQYVDRDNGFKGHNDKEYISGNHTDDTEMTIGSLEAMYEIIFNSNVKVDREFFWQTWFKTYQRLKADNGHPTIGHGNFEKYCNTPTPAMIDTLCKKQATDLLNSGNAPVMRCSPFILLSNPDKVAMISALATHPSPYSALSTVLLVWAGRYYLDHKSQEGLIPYLLTKLTKQESDFRAILEADPYINKQYITAAFNDLRTMMARVDTMPEPLHADGNDIDHRALEGLKDYTKPEKILDPNNMSTLLVDRDYWLDDHKKETGLNGGSFRTFICALFCLRWADNTTLWKNLRRIILFGGDVDTLAACIMPFVYAKMCGTAKDDLPEWVLKGLQNKVNVSALKLATELVNKYERIEKSLISNN